MVGARGTRWVTVLAVALAAATASAQEGAATQAGTPTEKAVTPPKLVQFVEAEYPAAAVAAGLEADVDLVLSIDADGRVTAADVSEARGHGFDEAAQAAALAFRFEPARRGDQPVASKILYRYSFHLDRKSAEPQATAAAVLRGRVEVSGGDAALAGARIVIRRDQELVREVVSDATGSWEARDLAPGRYRLTVSADGFEDYSVSETLGADEEVTVKYRLVAVVDDGEATTIVVHGERPAREVTRRTITRREMSRVPGTSGDALRSLQNLPGVARPPSLSGVLMVRGTPPTATPVFIEGMFLPNVYHLGGLSSVIPTELMEEINFYPGNYSVRFGRGLGGIVDVALRKTQDDGDYHGLAQIDLIDARAMLEGPVPLVDGWNFVAGFRRSHVDAWLVPLVDNEDTSIVAAPVYYDYQLFADKRLSKDSYLRVGFLGYDDRVRIIDRVAAEGGELDSVDNINGFGSLYTHRISDDLFLEVNLTAARLDQHFQLSTILFDTVAYGSVARAEVSYKMWPNATLVTGLDVLVAPYETHAQIPEDPGPSAPDIGSFVTTPTRTVDDRGTFFQPAIFAEMQMAPTRRWQVVSGVRLDYTHGIQHFDVSPRMTARYDIVQGFPRTTLKGGSGYFFQPPGFDVELFKDDQTELRTMRSWQNSLGVEQELSQQVELSAEGFYNVLDDLISRGPDREGVLRYNNEGEGRVYGAEFMLRYRADERFFGWLAYTLSRSERTWADGEPSQVFGLDQTHIFTILGSYVLGAGWELGARFRYVSGNPYTPCEGGIFSSTSTSYLCVNGPDNSGRLPPFHQLDIRVDKTWTFDSFKLGAYLDLINAYNRSNPDFMDYSYDKTESRPVSGSLPIVPSLGIRGEF